MGDEELLRNSSWASLIESWVIWCKEVPLSLPLTHFIINDIEI